MFYIVLGCIHFLLEHAKGNGSSKIRQYGILALLVHSITLRNPARQKRTLYDIQFCASPPPARRIFSSSASDMLLIPVQYYVVLR